MDSLLAAGDRDAVVELLFRELEDMSDEDMAAFKAAPTSRAWQRRCPTPASSSSKASRTSLMCSIRKPSRRKSSRS